MNDLREDQYTTLTVKGGAHVIIDVFTLRSDGRHEFNVVVKGTRSGIVLHDITVIADDLTITRL